MSVVAAVDRQSGQEARLAVSSSCSDPEHRPWFLGRADWKIARRFVNMENCCRSARSRAVSKWEKRGKFAPCSPILPTIAAHERNMGLWQHVWLESTGPVAVRDPAAMTDVRLPGASEAAVTVRCQLDNTSAVQRKVELRVRIAPDGFAGTPVEIRTEATASAAG